MSWGTSSGLLDLYEGTVESAFFATDANYQEGETPQLNLTIVKIENDEGVEVDEITEKFGVGKGYVVVDGGAAVEREDGNEKRKFNRKTRYGLLIDRVVKNKDGAFDGLLELLTDRGDPKNANVWVGLRFEFARHTENYGGDIGEIDFILPSKFLGVDEGVAGPATTDTASLREKVETVAKESDDFETFVGRALSVPGVTADAELVSQIGDESDAGIFASVRANA